MNTCTFFGHRDAPPEIEESLRLTLVDLIENKGVRRFYVGNNGRFDAIVTRQLQQLSTMYSIEYAVVLAYVPKRSPCVTVQEPVNTIVPEGIESVPPRYAIIHRNRWMVEQSDYVVTYVKYSTGGAAQFKKLAERKKKAVINLPTYNQSPINGTERKTGKLDYD